MSKQTVADLVRFIEDEAGTIEHALRTMSERNLSNASEIEGEMPVVARVLRESAASWSRKAERISELFEGLTESDQEWLDDHARGWVR